MRYLGLCGSCSCEGIGTVCFDPQVTCLFVLTVNAVGSQKRGNDDDEDEDADVGARAVNGKSAAGKPRRFTEAPAGVTASGVTGDGRVGGRWSSGTSTDARKEMLSDESDESDSEEVGPRARGCG